MKAETEEYDWVVVYSCEDRSRIGTIGRVMAVLSDGSVQVLFHDRETKNVAEWSVLTINPKDLALHVGDVVTVITTPVRGWLSPVGQAAKVGAYMPGSGSLTATWDGELRATSYWTVDDIAARPKVEEGDRVQALNVPGVSKANGKTGVVHLTGRSTTWIKFDEEIQSDDTDLQGRDLWVADSWARAEDPADAAEKSQAAEIQRLRFELDRKQRELADHEENFDAFKRKVVTAARIAARKEGWCEDGTNRVLEPLGLSLDDPADPQRFRFRVRMTLDVEADLIGDRQPGDVDDDFVEGSVTNSPLDGGELEMDGDWENVQVLDTSQDVIDVELVTD